MIERKKTLKKIIYKDKEDISLSIQITKIKELHNLKTGRVN